MEQLLRSVRWLGLGLAGVLLSACVASAPTPYGPALGEGGEGFADQQIEDNRYEIRFAGNPATPRATVERYLLFRAAEVTLASGADWFRFVERETRPGPASLPAVPETLQKDPSDKAAQRARVGHRAKPRARRQGYRRGYRRGHRRGYGYGYRHRYYPSGGVRFGFSFGLPYYGYYPWYRPYWGPYPYGYGYVPYYVRPRPRGYEAVAEILVFEGEKPADNDKAYAAAEVVEQLRPTIQFQPPPE